MSEEELAPLDGEEEKKIPQPLLDRITVKTLKGPTQTSTGLYLPETGKEKPVEGEVLAVGPGKFDEITGERVPLEFKVGQKVIFTKYAGVEIPVGDETYTVLSEKDVVAMW